MKPIDVPDTRPVRQRFGVPERYGACHTAVVEGYVIEGHVHARELRRLLKERPNALGLAVPGMPIGSPGMEQGSRRERYETLLIDERGVAKVYVHH
ncbi:MAG TPA: DUF411 domain-containing protein [Burkholderiales bacterium]|nr:DUF411 domain-containing protein [Burkholderiales bacterium]